MEEFPIVFTMSILVLFDVTVMMKLYFMNIILYLVFTVFWLKENEMIFGCIGLTDPVVCSNLSYNLFSALSVYLFDDALCYFGKETDSRIISV